MPSANAGYKQSVLRMQIIYYTKHGSEYVCRTDSGRSVWYKRDRDGLVPLAGAFHLPRTRLQALIAEYPRSAVDSTVCFGSGMAREFFEDARREHILDIPEGIETNIFFMIRKADDRYILGYSSTIERIERVAVRRQPQAGAAR